MTSNGTGKAMASFIESPSLSAIALPKKIKCSRCLKTIHQSKFSARQLNHARWQVQNSGRIGEGMKCQRCTGQQTVELECTMCDKTKGLEAFSKTQRAQPDTAVWASTSGLRLLLIA